MATLFDIHRLSLERAAERNGSSLTCGGHIDRRRKRELIRAAGGSHEPRARTSKRQIIQEKNVRETRLASFSLLRSTPPQRRNAAPKVDGLIYEIGQFTGHRDNEKENNGTHFAMLTRLALASYLRPSGINASGLFGQRLPPHAHSRNRWGAPCKTVDLLASSIRTSHGEGSHKVNAYGRESSPFPLALFPRDLSSPEISRSKAASTLSVDRFAISASWRTVAPSSTT